jgi:hypothetical protein
MRYLYGKRKLKQEQEGLNLISRSRFMNFRMICGDHRKERNLSWRNSETQFGKMAYGKEDAGDESHQGHHHHLTARSDDMSL